MMEGMKRTRSFTSKLSFRNKLKGGNVEKRKHLIVLEVKSAIEFDMKSKLNTAL